MNSSGGASPPGEFIYERTQMTISKQKAADIMTELGPLIEATLKRHGLDAPKLTWKYGSWFELKATSSVIEEGLNGVNLGSPEAQYFTRFGYMTMNGVKLEAPLGTIFSIKGDNYQFIGIAAKRSKYPIVTKRMSDGQISFWPDGVVAKLNDAASRPSLAV